jgi:hypothetical protein
MQAVWKSRTSKPLDIVTGHFMQAGFVALYADPRPSVFIDADFRKSAWITPERLKQSGTLVLWSTADFPRTDELPEPYREALNGLVPSFGFLLLPLGYGQTQTYGWAVLLPQESTKASPAAASAPARAAAPSAPVTTQPPAAAPVVPPPSVPEFRSAPAKPPAAVLETPAAPATAPIPAPQAPPPVAIAPENPPAPAARSEDTAPPFVSIP